MHVAELSRRLIERGHDVTVAIGPPSAGPVRDLLDSFGVPHTTIPSLVRSIRPLADRRARREIEELIVATGPDLVHCHSSKAGVVGRLAARDAGVPHVFTVHGWAFADGVPRPSATLWATVERVIARRCPGQIIVVSARDRDLAVRRGVVRPDRVTVVHNGVADLPAPALADPSARPATVAMVARFDDQKDYATLVDAVALAGIPDLRVVCIGEGPRIDQIRQQISASAATGIELLGLRNDVPALLTDAQAFVLTTNWEGLPLSIIEAMRAGLPTIATDVGGVSELVEDGVTGFLVPRNDPEAVAERMTRLVDDPDLAGALGRHARAQYLARFTVDRMVDATIDVYRRAIA